MVAGKAHCKTVMLFDILDLSLGSTLLGPSRFESGCFRYEEVL